MWKNGLLTIVVTNQTTHSLKSPKSLEAGYNNMSYEGHHIPWGSTVFADIIDLEKTDFAEKSDLLKV